MLPHRDTVLCSPGDHLICVTFRTREGPAQAGCVPGGPERVRVRHVLGLPQPRDQAQTVGQAEEYGGGAGDDAVGPAWTGANAAITSQAASALP